MVAKLAVAWVLAKRAMVEGVLEGGEVAGCQGAAARAELTVEAKVGQREEVLMAVAAKAVVKVVEA